MQGTLNSLDEPVAVCDRVSPSGDAPIDQAELRELTRTVVRQLGSGVADLTLEVIGREVVLSGRADSFYIKQTATCKLLPMLGGYRLTNALRVMR